MSCLDVSRTSVEMESSPHAEPKRVVRFAVRRNVSEDEVHVAWSIGDERSPVVDCELVVVQGLAKLTQEDRKFKRTNASGFAGPSAESAAILCAIHKVVIEDSRLPIKYKKRQVRKPVCEIPKDWLIAVANSHVVDLLECKTTCLPVIPYGRFLWPAVDGDLDRVIFSTDESMTALQFASIADAVMVDAMPNQVAIVNSRMGPLIITRHLVERYMLRLRNVPTVSAAIASIAIDLAAGRLDDVTHILASTPGWSENYKSSKAYVYPKGREFLAHIVMPGSDGNSIVTIYPLTGLERTRVAAFMGLPCD